MDNESENNYYGELIYNESENDDCDYCSEGIGMNTEELVIILQMHPGKKVMLGDSFTGDMPLCKCNIVIGHDRIYLGMGF
jgi:hypothetical protein